MPEILIEPAIHGRIGSGPGVLETLKRGLTIQIDSTDWRAAMQSIEWRPVPGYEGRYEVSNDGQVRSTAAVRHGGRVLKLRDHKSGHKLVDLHKDLTQKTLKVHRLVAMAFYGMPVVRHLNGDPADNRLENLAWGTQKENTNDTVTHGHNRNANKSHCLRGHEFTPDNTYIEVAANGHEKRKCRECQRIRDARRRSSSERGN